MVNASVDFHTKIVLQPDAKGERRHPETGLSQQVNFINRTSSDEEVQEFESEFWFSLVTQLISISV